MTERRRRRKGRRTFGATRQLPSGRWQASYIGSDRRRHTADRTFAESADAAAWLASVQHHLSRGDWPAPDASLNARVDSHSLASDEPFCQYGRRWIEERDLRPSSRERYERLWRLYLEPSFAEVAIGSLTPNDWRTWFAECRKRSKTSTQPASAYRLARAILNTAVEDGVLQENPCRIKRGGRTDTPERPVVSPQEV